MGVFDEATAELRRVMQQAQEPPERIEEAAEVLAAFGRVQRSGPGGPRSPPTIAAATRLSLARRDGQDDKALLPQLAAQHGAHPPVVSRLANTICDRLGLMLPPIPPAIAEQLGIDLSGSGGRLPLPRTASEAERMQELVELLRSIHPEVVPLHERAPSDVDPAAVTYVLRVTLDWEPDVWRDIELLGANTLYELHSAIQNAFSWDREHLWAFYMAPAKGRSRASDQDLGTVYGPSEDDQDPEVPLAAFGLRARRQFRYVFDFGDYLLHQLEVKRAGKPDNRAKYPRIVDKQGRAPPQYERW